MSALIKACTKSATIKNTGSECNESMGPTAMLYAVPRSLKWTLTDMEDFAAYLTAQIHAPKATRIYPMFGPEVPIRKITLSKESDVISVQEDGTPIFIRYGMITRAFSTTEGGICLAQALQSLNKSGYSILEVDNANQILMRNNGDGTYSALETTFMFSPSPDFADFKNPAYTNFQITYTPAEYVQFGEIFQGDSSISDLIGLFDTEIYQNGANVPTGGTAATGGYTIVKGATNDTIDVKVNGVSISGGPVLQTASESTDTLLAAKVKTAINAATATNGGYTANNTAGALTITAPVDLGASINAVQATATIVGTITTTTPVAFSGGVTGTVVLSVGVRTECAATDLIAKYGVTLMVAGNFVIKNAAGTVIVPSLVAITGGVGKFTIPYIADKYTVDGASAATWKAAGVEGFEVVTPAVITVV
jgi:hypothetical protein